jgi:hypothetical protein
VTIRRLLGLGLAAALSVPTVAGAQSPTQDSFVGSTVNAKGSSAYFNIRSGPSGENPTGTGQAGNDYLSGTRPITAVHCLAVTGSVATFVAAVEPYPWEQSPKFVKVTGVDRGDDPANPDQYAMSFVLALDPPTCTHLTGLYGDGVLTDGDFTVTDAQPSLPTSKDQCKNGGWRTYGVFKNQGSCVSFVATGGKNQPNGS